MCGIAGFCNGPSNSAELIKRMTDRIVHRGPDAEGFWNEPDYSVVLGHRRLSIIELSPLGAQPMISNSGRFVISFNGEIYNHQKIREEIIKNGIVFRGKSDTETLLESFEYYGVEKTLASIRGMFAIALYDMVEKRLYLMRDITGEKPIYYGFVNNRFIFASDISSIESISDGKLEIDSSSLELFFRRGYIPSPYSIYKNIYKLEPGHYLSLEYPFDKYEDKTYWSANEMFLKALSNRFSGSIEEAESELETLIKQSLSGQMISDVPLGAFLSAGIDSSTVVSLMQEISDKPVNTYTIGVDVPGYNEAPIAKEISKILGTVHTEEYISPEVLKKQIPLMSDIYSEPFADSSQIPTYLISKVAKKNVTVVLSGDGGDELFCGYERYNGWVRREWENQNRFPYPIQYLRGKGLSLIGKGKTVKARRLLSNSFSKLYSSVLGNDTDFVLNRDNYSDKFDSFDETGFESVSEIMMHMDFSQYLTDDLLTKVDRAAMACSLETRIPYLYREVIEFVWSLPYEMKYRDNTSKFILRRILYKRIPKEILDRPKTGFSIPLHEWMRAGELREWAEELLDNADTLNIRNLIDMKKCRRMWDAFISIDYWNEQIWYLLMFLDWYRKRSFV